MSLDTISETLGRSSGDPEKTNLVYSPDGPRTLTNSQMDAEKTIGSLDPLAYARNRWRPGRPDGSISNLIHPTSLGTRARESIQGGIEPDFVKSLIGKSPLRGALTYGVTGAAIGGAAGALKDKLTGTSGTAPMLALILGLLGSAGGAYSGFAKQAYRLPGGDPRDDLVRLVQSSFEASGNTKSTLIHGIQLLSGAQAAKLGQVVMTAGVGGAMTLIAKYLFGLGLIPSLMMGLGGVGLVNTFGGGGRTDALGQRSHVGSDIFGNPY